jgi:hypothetical protein
MSRTFKYGIQALYDGGCRSKSVSDSSYDHRLLYDGQNARLYIRVRTIYGVVYGH